MSPITRPRGTFPGHTAGDVCWIDLGTPDSAAAASFYSQLFGWVFADADSAGYRLATLRENLVAALGPATDPPPPYWNVYIRTDDVEASTAAATAAGGTVVVPPTPAGDAGISALVRHPTAGPLFFWQPGTHLGGYASEEHGALAYVEFAASSTEEDRRFLHRTLQWDLDPTHGVLTCRGRPVAKWEPSTPSWRAGHPSPWLVAFTVSDVAAVRHTALGLGASRTERPDVLIDPAGARFALTDSKHAWVR